MKKGLEQITFNAPHEIDYMERGKEEEKDQERNDAVKIVGESFHPNIYHHGVKFVGS